jgi:hypothetical protein
VLALRPAAPTIEKLSADQRRVKTLTGLDGDRAAASGQDNGRARLVAPPISELGEVPVPETRAGPGAAVHAGRPSAVHRTAMGLGPPPFADPPAIEKEVEEKAESKKASTKTADFGSDAAKIAERIKAAEAAKSEPRPIISNTSTLPDTPEMRAAVASMKAGVESQLPSTTRESPGAKYGEGKVIPFPATRKDEEAAQPAARADAEPKALQKAEPDSGRAPVRKGEAGPPPLPVAEPRAPHKDSSHKDEQRALSKRPVVAVGSTDNLDIHDEFFAEGDEGRYEGGPATIAQETREVAALVEQVQREKSERITRTPEQEERRARNVKLVAGVIGFGLAVAVVGVIRARSHADAPKAQPSTVVDTAAVAPPPPPAVTQAPLPQEPQAVQPPAEQAIEVPPPPPEPEPEPEPVEKAAPAGKPPAEKPVARPAEKPVAPRPPVERPPVAARPPAEKPVARPPVEKPAPPTPAPPSEGKPPTASFPIQ